MDPVSQHVLEVQTLFLRHANVLRGFILALLPGQDVVEDVLQETFLTLTAHVAEFRTGTNFLAWARATARFKVMEQIRRDRRRPIPFDEATIELLVTAASEFNDGWEERLEALRMCVEELPPRARELIGLRYASEEPGLDEVAGRGGWTVGAVKVALSRARACLLDCVNRKLAQPGVRHGS